MTEPQVPLRVRLAFALASTLVASGLAEAMVRLADANALPNLGIFADSPDGRIVLRPHATARVRRADGGVYTVATDGLGLRSAPAEGRWIAVGDSQVLGMGVAGDETFAAGAGLRNAGVPGYGVADALAQATALLPVLHPDGVLVVVNQANDWDEGLAPATARTVVRGGWLLTRAGAASAGAWFWSTPLSRVHLLYLAWMRLSLARPDAGAPTGAPTGASTRASAGAATGASAGAALGEATTAGLGDPAAVAPITTALAGAIRGFAAAHPEVRTTVAFLPVDAATSAARARVSPFPVHGSPWTDTGLRDGLRAALAEVPMIDLLPALADPSSFLDHDYHLSAAGHARVATVLRAELR